MTPSNPILIANAHAYSQIVGVTLKDKLLGHGTDGCVWESSRLTAIKALERDENYRTELECYHRFRAGKITRLGQFAVPEFVHSNDALLVIEIKMVSPPFILDFAKAVLDRPREFEEGQHDEWLATTKELFDDNWPQVRALLGSLRQLGIYYYDAKPGNIRFP